MAGELQDRPRRKVLTALTVAAGGIAAGGSAIPFVLSFGPSERTKAAGGPVEVDLGAIKHSELHTVEWRGHIHRPYRIVYRVREDQKLIEILRVWHAARGIPRIHE